MTTEYEKALERGYIGNVPAEKNPKDAQQADGSPAAGPKAAEKPAQDDTDKAAAKK